MTEVVDNTIIIVVTQGPPELFDSSSELEVLEALEGEAIHDNVISRFLSSDIEFFNSFYDNKSSNIEAGIEYIGKKIYFRNVTMFINRIKNIAKVKNIKLSRNNL